MSVGDVLACALEGITDLRIFACFFGFFRVFSMFSFRCCFFAFLIVERSLFLQVLCAWMFCGVGCFVRVA